MIMTCQSEHLSDYLSETSEVDYSHPAVKRIVELLFLPTQTDSEKIQAAYEYVRDRIAHTWDMQGTRITCSASETFMHKEGFCYAKSNALAALLRSQGIPAGFCYQRLMLFDKPEDGYCIHALNAVHVAHPDKWIRLDARGNKPGIDAQFSLQSEQLAFSVDKKAGEMDYPIIYTKPHPETIKVLKTQVNALDVYKYHLPESL